MHKRQYNAESELTRKQMKDLSLDEMRLIESMKIEGKSFGDIKTAIRGLDCRAFKSSFIYE